MIENIAIWGGVAGLIASLFAVIILFLTKQNINNILNKDAILFNESFTTKKEAISSAMAIADELIETECSVKANADFIKRAKTVYNNLLCVLSDVRIADEFYDVAIDGNIAVGAARLTQLKLMLRSDIGLKSGKSKAIKRELDVQKNVTPNQQSVVSNQPMQQFQPNVQQVPVQQPAQPVQPTTAQPAPRTTTQPVRPVRPTAPSGTQSRPVAPSPTAQPVRRSVPPKNEA